MRNRDWSLVFFTTLSQWSVGIILCFTLLSHFDNDMYDLTEEAWTLKNPVSLALVFVGVATFISFLHLGNPSNAHRTLNNLSGSWVSREILALGIYSTSLSIILVSAWKHWNTGYVNFLLLPASVFGMVLLWMMIRIYVMPTIPAWNSWYTRLSFVATAICLGLLTFLLFQHTGLVNLENQAGKTLKVAFIAILCVEIASGVLHQFQLEKMNTGIDELVFNQGVFYKVFLIRMAILSIACLVMFIIVFKPGLFSENGNHVWIYPLLLLVVVQELMGRLLFYSSYFRIGV